MRTRLTVRVRATVAATAVVAIALVGTAAVLDGVLAESLRSSAELDAGRRAAVTAELISVPPHGSRPTPTCRSRRRSRSLPRSRRWTPPLR